MSVERETRRGVGREGARRWLAHLPLIEHSLVAKGTSLGRPCNGERVAGYRGSWLRVGSCNAKEEEGCLKLTEPCAPLLLPVAAHGALAQVQHDGQQRDVPQEASLAVATVRRHRGGDQRRRERSPGRGSGRRLPIGKLLGAG